MGLVDNLINKVLADWGVTPEDVKGLKTTFGILKKLANGLDIKEEENGTIRITLNPRKTTIFLEVNDDKGN